MKVSRHLRMPPRMTNFENKRRQVGVELEFAAVSADRTAARIAALYGGEITREDAHRYHITGTRFGDFTAELDTQYAHRPAGETDEPGEGLAGLLKSFRQGMREVYGDVGSLVIPYEVVCPPVAIEEITELERLLDALREEGARGTRENLLHAFGAQFNPDIATDDPEWILAVLKAQILLSDWLRAIMSLDTARQMFAFADPFPAAYAAKILDPAYWPGLDEFMHDYLVFNPTRNRELDLLPLFAWFDEPLVRSYVAGNLVKKRPTFHYRLPDANISQPDWNLTLEWNRWVVVEDLAEDRDRLGEMGEAYLKNADQLLPDDWAMQCTEWLTGVRG